MRKKIILLAISCLVSAGLAFGQKTLSVSSGSGFPGDTVAINVNLNDGSGVGGLQFDLSYDSSVLSIVDSDSDGELNDEIARGSLLTSGHTLTVNTTTLGLVSAIVVGVDSMNSGTGSVIRVIACTLSSAEGCKPLRKIRMALKGFCGPSAGEKFLESWPFLPVGFALPHCLQPVNRTW